MVELVLQRRRARGAVEAGLGMLRLLSGVLLAALVLMICYDALARYLFSAPTSWSLEMSGFLVLYFGTLGAVDTLASRQHIRMTLFSGMLPLPLRRVLWRAIALVGTVFCGLIAWRGGLMTLDAFLNGERVSSAFGTPLFIPYALVPTGFGLMALQFLIFAVGPIVDDDDL